MTRCPITGSGHRIVAPPALILAKGDVGYEINGTDHTLRGAAVTGGLQGILFNQTSDSITVDGYTATDPESGYGGYHTGTAADSHKHHWLRNFKITINKGKSGQHGWRFYGLDNAVIEDWTLSHYGNYPGATINARRLSNTIFRRLKTFGRPPGFGPDASNAGEDSYRVSNVVIEDATFDLNGDFLSTWADASPITFWPGASNITLRRCTVYQRNSAKKLFRCEGPRGAKPAATNITIDTCALHGGSGKADGGNVAGIRFVNC